MDKILKYAYLISAILLIGLGVITAVDNIEGFYFFGIVALIIFGITVVLVLIMAVRRIWDLVLRICLYALQPFAVCCSVVAFLIFDTDEYYLYEFVFIGIVSLLLSWIGTKKLFQIH